MSLTTFKTVARILEAEESVDGGVQTVTLTLPGWDRRQTWCVESPPPPVSDFIRAGEERFFAHLSTGSGGLKLSVEGYDIMLTDNHIMEDT